jgi:type I restriction enzyme S subunit
MMDLLAEHIATWTGAEIPKVNGGRGRGRGTNGQSPHGIKKLRELILELAVRGKLVEQDPNDEPASVLLEKIAKEKARLIKKGKIKKQKTLPKISEDEITFALPDGWKITRFGQLINLVSGQHLKPQEYSESMEEGMVPYLTGPAEFGNLFPSATRYTYEKRALASEGDILITCKGSGVGKLNVADTVIAISRQLMSIQPVVVNTLYVKLMAEGMNKSLREKIVGIAIPGISREDVTEGVVALPPLAEQHRIVAKVDELMALCDRLKAGIKESRTRQARLSATLIESALQAA